MISRKTLTFNVQLSQHQHTTHRPENKSLVSVGSILHRVVTATQTLSLHPRSASCEGDYPPVVMRAGVSAGPGTATHPYSPAVHLIPEDGRPEHQLPVPSWKHRMVASSSSSRFRAERPLSPCVYSRLQDRSDQPGRHGWPDAGLSVIAGQETWKTGAARESGLITRLTGDTIFTIMSPRGSTYLGPEA